MLFRLRTRSPLITLKPSWLPTCLSCLTFPCLVLPLWGPIHPAMPYPVHSFDRGPHPYVGYLCLLPSSSFMPGGLAFSGWGYCHFLPSMFAWTSCFFPGVALTSHACCSFSLTSCSCPHVNNSELFLVCSLVGLVSKCLPVRSSPGLSLMLLSCMVFPFLPHMPCFGPIVVRFVFCFCDYPLTKPLLFITSPAHACYVVVFM